MSRSLRHGSVLPEASLLRATSPPMKWYFAISESSLGLESHDWPRLIKVAVASAQAHTSLQPRLLYDGQPNDLTRWMERRGVQIIHHRVPFLDAFEPLARGKEHGREWLAMVAGTFLRIEIPQVEREQELVLYTDCDIMFQPGFRLDDLATPKFFAASGRKRLVRRPAINAGVMLINVPAMRREYTELVQFIRGNVRIGLDQEMLIAYFGRRIDLLPDVLNWYPYRGIEPQARLVHFHGPKPTPLQIVFDHPEAIAGFPDEWKDLLRKNPAAYRHYVGLWRKYAEGLV